MEANEHEEDKINEAIKRHILNSIEEILTNQKFIFERLQKLEDKTHNTGGDKALLSKLNMDVAENRAALYYVEDELRNHCKEEATNGKD